MSSNIATWASKASTLRCLPLGAAVRVGRLNNFAGFGFAVLKEIGVLDQCVQLGFGYKWDGCQRRV
jgi:hypothetical protein